MDEREFYRLHHRIVNHKPKHRLKVESIIGRQLKTKEAVHHHYNADGSVILILCENQIYHSLLHARELALRYCGHANWVKCTYCKKYDNPKNLSITKNMAYHKICKNDYMLDWKRKER